MSDETAAALDVAVTDYRVTGDEDALRSAAQAHIDDSRMLEVIKGEYDAVQEARAAGEPWDEQEKISLAEELNPVRTARAILDGQLPGRGAAAEGGVDF